MTPEQEQQAVNLIIKKLAMRNTINPAMANMALHQLNGIREVLCALGLAHIWNEAKLKHSQRP